MRRRCHVGGLVHGEHERKRAFDPTLADLGVVAVERDGAALADTSAVVGEVGPDLMVSRCQRVSDATVKVSMPSTL